LRNKCQQGEQNSQAIAKMALEWKNKVQSAQQGLEAFEMVKTYERIADSLQRANNHTQHVLGQYTDAKTNLDELTKRTDDLKNRNQELTAKLNDELEKKVNAESDYVKLNGQFTDLDSRHDIFSVKNQKLNKT
jgi:chromosome segregation ATPase